MNAITGAIRLFLMCVGTAVIRTLYGKTATICWLAGIVMCLVVELMRDLSAKYRVVVKATSAE